MLTKAWYPLRHHPLQAKLWRTQRRFVNVAAGRGSGKTEIARRRVVRMLPVRKPWSDPLYFYALPTYKQAKRVAWNQIKKLVPDHWLAPNGINNSDMTITTKFGSQLLVVGMDRPERFEGSQYDGGVIDESCDQKPGIFNLNVGPALTHRYGWCWRIGVPKRAGVGAAEFKAAWMLGASNDDPECESYTWPSEDILTPQQLRFARENLDIKDYNEQYKAHWETVAGLVFYAFHEVTNVREVMYDLKQPLLIGSDFNVDPMAWVIAQEHGTELHVLDELWIRNTNTQETLNALHRRFPNHQSGYWFYGDATGRARKTSASESDYIQIKNDTRFSGARVFYPMSNPPVANRFASCNALFCNAAETRRCFVHPRCKHLIKDLTHRGYKPGSCDPDDSGDVGHITDALGYLIHMKYPVRFVAPANTPNVGVTYGGGTAA